MVDDSSLQANAGMLLQRFLNDEDRDEDEDESSAARPSAEAWDESRCCMRCKRTLRDRRQVASSSIPPSS
ncbi:hypothetical protein SCP_1500570 [Sparassis crispa]|uniref:Uncharacterized protein n=1 Tax=Sparassis crispa TaxID=139825 RepID=A0A401H3P2_9APHY|nr:hypothetical protein SCP_1500570 [Sparassis crispa]GBE89055.1 hypothetical protein SCP_1500570 [Sparassis crispa]